MVNVQFREPLYNISDTNHKTMRSNYLKGIMSQTSGEANISRVDYGLSQELWKIFA